MILSFFIIPLYALLSMLEKIWLEKYSKIIYLLKLVVIYQRNRSKANNFYDIYCKVRFSHALTE